MAVRTNKARWIESQGYWEIKVQRDGVRKRFTSSTPGRKGKTAAERKADEWLERGCPSDVRFQEVWDEYLAEKKATTGTANWTKLDSLGRNWLLPKLKTRKFSTITDQDWQDRLTAVAKAGRAKRTVEHVRSVIIAVCKFARKKRIISEMPFDLTIPKGLPVGKKDILQAADIKKVFTIDTMTVRGKVKPAFFINAWRFMLVTGLRRGECCGIRKEDISTYIRENGNGAAPGVLTLRRSINSLHEVTSGKNENALRTVTLPQKALVILADQERLLRTMGIISPWVFPDTDGGQVDTNKVYKHWVRFRTEHGIAPRTIHEMRHTMISFSKVDIAPELLKLIVGHSKSMDTFGVYGHEVDGEARLAADTLDTIFEKILK